MDYKTNLILAIDTKDYEEAKLWAAMANEAGQLIKLGMQFIYANGFEAVKTLTKDNKFFLDLKLHDIPNTVACAISSLSYLTPSMLTVHSLGGKDMIKAARKAVDQSFHIGSKPLLLGVTILTSMDQSNLQSIGLSTTPKEQVLLLAKMALENGVDGLVCSSHEVAYLKQYFGNELILVVPGIRLDDSEKDDQKRTMTPLQAREAGADWIVVGRPITKSVNPQKTLQTILDQLQG